MDLTRLPIDPFVGSIVDLVRKHRAAVVVAPPGAGKTTRIPPALADDGATILLQPRRVAARSLARRIAAERGWTLGREVGWHVRFDRRASDATRLLVATEGVLTARLQHDPLLTGVRTVVLDEFHERSVHADLAIALAREAWRARPDLRLVVMSATLDADPVAAYLGGCPVVEVPGRPFPVTVGYEPTSSVTDAVRAILARAGGHVLCFLPGAPEIARAARDLAPRAPDAAVLPLHGSLDADAQDAALAPSARRKVILATNIAETSLTVEGVTDVVDTGLHKVLRADDALGIDRLATERISRDGADQRAGRAGRTAPGRAVRLWDARDALRATREAELVRIDLAGPCLALLAWGADPRAFGWFESPPIERVESALELLTRLGATHAGRITDLGRILARVPLHPRLARVLVAAGGASEAAAACAILSERWTRPRDDEPSTTDSDLLALADRIAEAPASIRRAAERIARLAGAPLDALPGADPPSRETLLRAVLAGYPDRVARRREPGSPRLVLASGHGAVLGPESGVRDGDWLVAVDVTAGRRGPGSEALVRLASRVEREWLTPDRVETLHVFDEASQAVRASQRAYRGAIVLTERAVDPDPIECGRMVADRILARGLGERGERLRRRLSFAGRDADLDALVRRGCLGLTRIPAIESLLTLPAALRRDLDRLAPETLAVPSGRRIGLDYRDDGSAVCAVKLQELFGLAASPRIGPRNEPVVFELLAPNGRTVQTTRDLASFWRTAYAEVRRELRGRYPRHPWPEDPGSARPTHRPKPRR